jgi:polysaccharide export outer membrane protein
VDLRGSKLLARCVLTQVVMVTNATRFKTSAAASIAFALTCFVLYSVRSAVACQTGALTPGATVQTDMTQPRLQPRFPRYLLRTGDVLELNFPFTPEFNQTITIQPDGYVTLRGLADVRIQDKSLPDAIELLRKEYSRILRDPVITVELKDFEKPYFIVGGEVAHPGKYDLRGETTILQAVMIAGDFKSQSRKSQVLVFRRTSDEWAEVRKFDLKKMLSSKNLTEDVRLRPGDMVFVPKSAWSKFERFIPVASIGMFFNPLSY